MATLNPRIVNKLKQVPDVAVKAAARAMEEGAEEIVQAMKAIAPVGAYAGGGDLRDSIGWTWGDVPAGSFMIDEIRSGRNRGDQYATLRIKIYAGSREAFYARFIEFGTAPHSLETNASVLRGLRQDKGGVHPGTPAQPFFFPTWKQMRTQYRNKIRAAVRAAVKEAWKNG
ncbi:HK97-gp10 family putative phage morphogenesis protein [Paracoccus onubensis]|uniref:HK97 gp10 family phage protein n=1 Tax=Paracoccus onubensis TaxID=1675788 RepID=A0A418T4B9_9RHOB|nr:HK97-gp10 family putative phage morphogenesis protein [Paracoccus onubensis]RJE87960.1 HK97 gp10 family phage protein [Paracoccus onubensis]